MIHRHRGRRERRNGPRPAGRAGSAASGLVLWLFGLALFCLPFLRERDGLSYEGEDWRRAENDFTLEENLAYAEGELGTEVAGPLRAASDALFAPGADYLETGGLIEHWRLPAGRELYTLHCAGCHGDLGDGSGPAARHLSPRPRNFTKGVFKFTSTANGVKPLREDLMRIVRDGLPGSAMPSFRLITEESRRDLVEYVRFLAIRGEFEELFWGLALDDGELPEPELVRDLVHSRWSPENVQRVYPGAAETPRGAESVARGEALFLDPGLTNCFACHGKGGRGDGPNALDYVDDWGYPVVPRDLTAGTFRSGEDPENLFLAIATGINGTPMGNFDGNLTGEQIWDLVHFVQSLSEKGSRAGGGR